MRLQRLVLWLKSKGVQVTLVLISLNYSTDQLTQTRANVDQLEIASPDHPLLHPQSRRKRFITRLRLGRQAMNARKKIILSGSMHEFAANMVPGHVNSLVRRIALESPVDYYLAYYPFTLQAFVGLAKSIPLICDTVEVFSMTRLDPQGSPSNPVLSFSPDEERQMLLQADIVLAIQYVEANYLSSLLPERPVLTVGIDFEMPTDPGLPSMADELIGIIGSDNEANWEGLQCFLLHSWPLILASNPNARLVVAGKLGKQLSVQHATTQLPAGVITEGWVKDLGGFYRSLRFALNPVLRGTGLKIKTVEALAHGRPVVSFPVGLEGIDFPGMKPWRLATTPQEMAEACSTLLQDPEHCDAMANTALQVAKDIFSANSVYAPLERLLGM
jgi:glycosyltransferase involved in cell wall biosynthesis